MQYDASDYPEPIAVSLKDTSKKLLEQSKATMKANDKIIRKIAKAVSITDPNFFIAKTTALKAD